MNRRILLFLIGGFFYISIFSFFVKEFATIKVYAEDIVDEYEDIDDGYTSLFIEDEEYIDNVLQDREIYIEDLKPDEDIEILNEENKEEDKKEIISENKSLSRGFVNTYDSSKEWLFNEEYYYTSNFQYHVGSGSLRTKTAYIFPELEFGEPSDTRSRVNQFKSLALAGRTSTVIGVEINDMSYIVCIVGASVSNPLYVDDITWPDNFSNLYWSEPTITPDPTPEPTITPDPTPTPDPDPMPDNTNFHIMVIFALGLCSGVIVGHFLTGFIK